MGYRRFRSTEPEASSRRTLPDKEPTSNPKKSKIKFLLIIAATLIVASVISAALVMGLRTRANSGSMHPTQAISRTLPDSLSHSLWLMVFPGTLSASDEDLFHISVNVTLQHFGRALYVASEINNLVMDTRVRSAYDDCLELLDDSVELLSRSLISVVPNGGSTGSTQDVMTWLSALEDSKK